MKLLKLYHKIFVPKGEWLYIANEREQGKVDDDLIYFYVEDNIDLNKIKKGMKIELDEPFEVMEVEQ